MRTASPSDCASGWIANRTGGLLMKIAAQTEATRRMAEASARTPVPDDCISFTILLSRMCKTDGVYDN